MRVDPLLVALLMLTGALAGCASTETTQETDDGSQEVLDETPTEIAGAIPVPEGTYDFTGPFSKVLQAGSLDILPQGRFEIASEQDGEPIEMALWLPKGDGPFPVMLFSSPYFWDPESVGGHTGTGFPFVASTRTVDKPGGAVQNLIEQLVPHGYAFATHSVRGFAGSDGCNDLMGPKEVADIDQAVTWLGTQSWSNGNVAMTGVSYDGSTPWSAASTGNPHLKTIIPISGVPDIHGLMYRNGSSENRGPFLLNALYYELGLVSGPVDGVELGKRVLCPDAWEGLALSGVAGLVGTDPLGYWQERNRKPAVLENYKGSVFSVQGLQDWNVDPSQVVPWVDELNRSGIKTKQLLGQWGHNWPDNIWVGGGLFGQGRADPSLWGHMRADHNEILLRWLDSELKGLDVDTGPPVQVADNLGRWRSELSYPPRDAKWGDWYLTGDGGLAKEAPASDKVTLVPILTEFAGNMPFLADGAIPGWADFELPVYDRNFTIAGLPKVHLSVVPHGPGGYLAAYLYDKDLKTSQMRDIGWTTMNLAYADGGTEFKPVVPEEEIVAKLEVQPMDAVIQKGHQLILRVWVVSDGGRLPTIPPTSVDILFGDGKSMMSLPTVERGPKYYFEPPMAS